jgi:hypothetical protein
MDKRKLDVGHESNRSFPSSPHPPAFTTNSLFLWKCILYYGFLKPCECVDVEGYFPLQKGTYKFVAGNAKRSHSLSNPFRHSNIFQNP